jgi:hypothetical protein
VFYSTGAADHNTTPPTGKFADGGWQYQGNWRGFGGTVIASNLFLSARHVGGTVGETFWFENRAYPTVTNYPDTLTDLVVWKVCGTFPRFAPLYTGAGELDQQCLFYGAGLGRGDPVEVATGTGTRLCGWRWVGVTSQLRWGANTVSGIDDTSLLAQSLLKADFNAGNDPNEAGLAGGDSGGGMFLRQTGHWALAGVNYAVDGPFNTTDSGNGFSASIFDARGLYAKSGGNWVRVEETPAPQPAASYFTRVSARLEWLQSVILAHDGKEEPPVVESAPDPAGPFSVEPVVAVNPDLHAVRVNLPSGNRFYRLYSCRALRIVTVKVIGPHLGILYE